VRAFCLFIGTPRSGHSMIGALLDAHPAALIAHELDALKYVHARFSRQQLFFLLIERARLYATSERMRGSYVYQVPSAWRGRFEELRVIGDKHGEATTWRLRSNPELFDRLRDTVDVPVKFIQVIRNPYDSISTISQKHRRQGRALSLAQSMDLFFTLCETISTVRRQIAADDLFQVRHEAFVEQPRRGLCALCSYLGLDAPESYLDACEQVVFPAPHRSRLEVAWTPELIDVVAERMEPFPFLAGYGFED
jgi:hypothetical protein